MLLGEKMLVGSDNFLLGVSKHLLAKKFSASGSESLKGTLLGCSLAWASGTQLFFCLKFRSEVSHKPIGSVSLPAGCFKKVSCKSGVTINLTDLDTLSPRSSPNLIFGLLDVNLSPKCFSTLQKTSCMELMMVLSTLSLFSSSSNSSFSYSSIWALAGCIEAVALDLRLEQNN